MDKMLCLQKRFAFKADPFLPEIFISTLLVVVQLCTVVQCRCYKQRINQLTAAGGTSCRNHCYMSQVHHTHTSQSWQHTDMSSDDSHQLILSPLSFEKPSPLDDWGRSQVSVACKCMCLHSDKNIIWSIFLDSDSEYESVSVATPHGRCEVVKEGHVSGASIITLHDLGLNHVTNFKKLFSSPSLDMLSSHFTIYHVNAPGQELGADAMSEDESYPSMEQLSECVEHICHFFG